MTLEATKKMTYPTNEVKTSSEAYLPIYIEILFARSSK